jgi:uncharacterized protein YjaZ
MKMTTKIVTSSVLALLFTSGAYADIKVEDYTKPFISGYKSAKNHSLHADKRYVVHYETVLHPKVCRIFFEGHSLPRDPRIDATLNDYAANLPSFVKEYEKKVPVIEKITKEVQDRTQKLFGKEIYANVVIAPSLSDTDAVTMGSSDDKRATVALNMRVISKYSEEELKIVIAHELFHVLQHQLQKDHSNEEPIAGNLFSEGWATYASSLVYPGYSDWKYISYFTKNDHQFNKFESERKGIIKNILRDWNSKSDRKYDKYFSADLDASHPFEPRSGYYLGYMMAKAMAEKQSPVQVALIKYSDFKKQAKPLLIKMSKLS